MNENKITNKNIIMCMEIDDNISRGMSEDEAVNKFIDEHIPQNRMEIKCCNEIITEVEEGINGRKI